MREDDEVGAGELSLPRGVHMRTMSAVTCVGIAVLCACMCMPVAEAGPCAALGNCNSHGSCVATNLTCTCYDGWGSDSDVSVYKAADCSKRICPADLAWTDVPTAATTAHATAECSNAGICNRNTGKCECFDGFEGDACQRMSCPNDCSGHGKCVSLSVMASEANAFPTGISTSYGSDATNPTTTWDAERIYGCVCDSSWSVGWYNGETQVTEWFGPDCSLKRCPSGDDPMTTTVDETDCENKADNGASFGTGRTGNKCHIDCANRGICDYSTGVCDCFAGFYGEACTLTSVLAK